MVAVTGSPTREGLPYPLGATWDGKGVNFALFLAHATRVELCLFDDEGERETTRIELPEFTDEIWHGMCRMFIPARSTAIASMVRTSLVTGTGLIPTSWCSTPMPAGISTILEPGGVWLSA